MTTDNQIEYDEISEDREQAIALEKMVYSQFKRKFTVFKRGDIPAKLTDLSSAELPTNSILHTVSHLLDPQASDIAPDVTLPIIANESFVVYLQNHVKIPAKDDENFPVTDRYRFVAGRFLPEVQKFFQTHKQIRKVSSLDAVLGRATALTIFNYNPILHTYLQGQMIPLRRFQILLNTMLANIMDIDNSFPGKLHHIHIPLSGDTYSKIQIDRTFKLLSKSTIRVWDDMSFFFLIHFLGFLADSETTLLSKLPQGTLDRTHVIFTCNAESIIYNLGDLKAMTGTNANFYIMVLRHLNALKLVGSETIKSVDQLSEHEVDALAEKQAETKEARQKEPEEIPEDTTVELAEPIDVRPEDRHQDAPITVSEKKPAKIEKIVHEQQTHTEFLEASVHAAIKSSEVPLSTVQKQRLEGVVDRLQTIELGGQTFSELLSDTSDPDIHGRDVQALSGVLPDASMTKSSINKFDEIYIKQQLNRDIASVLTSLGSDGMFIQDLREHDEISEFNRVRHYTATFTDVTGKRHSMKFKLPIVSSEGTVLLNGIRSRMIKQNVNLPICKVSPRRVNLASNFNKTLVERSDTKAHRFDIQLTKYMGQLVSDGKLNVTYGRLDTEAKLPYDYVCIASRYDGMSVGKYTFTFDYVKRMPDQTATEALLTDAQVRTGYYSDMEKKLTSIFCGMHGKFPMYYGMDNVIRVVDSSMPDPVIEAFTIREFFAAQFGETHPLPSLTVEWTELKLLDRSFPVIFVLGYQFGLTNMLKELNHPYRFIPAGKRVTLGADEVVITFADGKLIFPRYPLATGLILGGLSRFSLKEYMFGHLDLPDTYFTILSENRLSTNYLKGIRDFFKFFVDPITRDVLLRMNEPTTAKGLLIRSSQMLATTEHSPASSMSNHRLRGYERLADILYVQLSRELASQASQVKMTGKRAFSINPEKVLMAIVQDQTLQPLEEINPIHDIKMKNMLTYTGHGGRTSRAMVVADRIYPDDAVGILSEATPDSSKVAINAYMSADPRLDNIRGMYNTDTSIPLEPANILSATALLMPGALQDDAKRIGYISVQLSHHVPCEDGESMRIRTGYEAMVAHQTSETFACVADADGVVEKVDNDLKLVQVRYVHKPVKEQGTLNLNITRAMIDTRFHNDEPVFTTISAKDAKSYPIGRILKLNSTALFRVAEAIPFSSIEDVPETSSLTRSAEQELKRAGSVLYLRLTPLKDNPGDWVDVFKFGEKYTSISGSYLKQTIVLNVKAGDKVKAGDVIAYNSGFFEPDPYSKQVNWKHGVIATVAFMDRSETYEDSCEISREFGKRLVTSPGHIRTLEMTNDTLLTSIVNIGDTVETTDYLMTMEDSNIDSLMSGDDPDTLELLTSLNQKMPRAKYHGTVANIELYHTCDYQDLHPSLKKLAKALAVRRMAYYNAMKNTCKDGTVPLPEKVPVGTKYLGVDFLDETKVAIFITISEDLGCVPGDKLVLAAQAKTTIGSISERSTITESGVPVDMTFSSSGVSARILQSHLIQGIGESVLEKLEADITKMYFD